jgi:hypothetical protein
VRFVALQRGWYRAISMSCVTLPKWHGRGHRFDPDQDLIRISENRRTNFSLREADQTLFRTRANPIPTHRKNSPNLLSTI